MEFKAEKVNGKLTVKAVPERKQDGSLVMHIPSMPLINKMVKEESERLKKVDSLKK